jgi:hypothetical protein
MKEVKLTRGYIAIIDDEDYERISQLRWQALPSQNGKIYAKGSLTGKIRKEGQKYQQVLMHRFIMNAQPNTELDHINGNSLDNRKQNLRFTTHRENLRNRRKFKGTNTEYKGVIKRGNKYVMVLQVEFDTPEDAAKLWDKLSKIVYGEHSKTNYPSE